MEFQYIATVLILAHTMPEATATVAPIVAPFTFDVRKLYHMLVWCGLNPTQERLIPPVWKQLRAGTANTGKKDFLTNLLNPSNTVDYEVDMFLSKHLVTYTTTQKFGFGYTISYGTSHHGVTSFLFPSLYPTTMAQLDITQQAEYRSNMITII